MKPFTAFLVVAAGTGINSVRQIQKGNGPWGTILAGIVFGTICVGVNDATQSDLGTVLGMVFLLSSALSNGVPVIESLSKLAESN